jgi:hypothetical protein
MGGSIYLLWLPRFTRAIDSLNLLRARRIPSFVWEVHPIVNIGGLRPPFHPIGSIDI